MKALAESSSDPAASRVSATDARDASLKLLIVDESPVRAAILINGLREAGFTQVEAAGGDVISLARLAMQRLSPGGGPLLHVAGSVVAGDLKGDLEARGFFVTRVALYDAVAASELPEAAASALKAKRIDGALFYSPRTARSFAALVRGAEAEAMLAGVTAYCLSEAVADQLAGLPFAAIRVAAAPDQQSLLALLPK